MDRHVGEGGHNLLLRGKVGALLELKVTNGSAQGEIAIDSSEIDEATSRTDSCLLAFILGLVVEGEGLCATLDAED